jgi:HPt (histidine-containing phosphotransfer) domain-containing protein
LPEKWAKGDREEVLRIVHSLKSTSATFHAHILSELSAALEMELRQSSGSLDIEAHIQKIVAEYMQVQRELVVEKQKLLDQI